MKIKTKFDLLKKVKHSKEGVRASEVFLQSLKTPPFLLIVNFILLASVIGFNGVLVFVYIAGCTLALGVSNLILKMCKQEIINKAEFDLQVLVNELSNLEVKTSVELLQEAKINQVDYKIKYEDADKFPKLVQCKYIDIPLANGYEETLLQEHIYGDKDYELSVNSPVKKMVYKALKSNI